MSASRRSRREVTTAEARQVIGGHLRARRGEIEQELLARVGVFSQDEDVDPEYALGLRDSVSIALEYGIQCVESSELSVPPVPTQLYAQARLAARHRVEVGAVIARYFDGYTLLEVLVEEAAEAEELLGTKALREIRRVSSLVLKRLIAEIGKHHADEARQQAASPEALRVKLVRQQLAGQPIDAAQLNYDFNGFHVGLVAKGQGVAHAIKGLAETLDCISLIVDPPNAPTWAWLGRRTAPDVAQMEKRVSDRWPDRSALAIGQIGRGLVGWRLSHRQALAALPIAMRMPEPVVRYRSVALLASALRDDLLMHSLRTRILEPLENGRNGGRDLRETIRAYLAADQNSSSTAARLGVNRRTVTSRLRAIEGILGSPLSEISAEVDLALRLDQLVRSSGP